MNIRVMVVAGPPSSGKTAVVKHMIRHLGERDRVAYLKIDVVAAFEDEEMRKEFGIPARKVYSGDMCPDHMGIMVMEDAVSWAQKEGASVLIIESAGLCLRCTPYLSGALGICVISSLSGTHAPLKMAPMITFSDVCVVTKTDLISQAEKEVFRESIRRVSRDMDIVETNAIQGTGLKYLYRILDSAPPCRDAGSLELRGTPPLGVCTICVGKKKAGWRNHFGVIRRLEDSDNIYNGE